MPLLLHSHINVKIQWTINSINNHASYKSRIKIFSSYHSHKTLHHHQQEECMWMEVNLKFPSQSCWKFKSSRMLYHADWWTATDVSERYSTFTCRVKQTVNSEPLRTGCHRYQTFKLWHPTSMTIHVDNDSLKWNISTLMQKRINSGLKCKWIVWSTSTRRNMAT